MLFARTNRFRRVRAIICWLLALTLVLAAVGCGGSSSSPPLRDTGQGAGAAAASFILKQLGAAAAKYVTSKGMGWLLSLVTGGSGSDSQDQQAFTEMEADLGQIIGDLNDIKKQLSDLLSEVQIELTTLESYESDLSMKDAQDDINNEYANFQAMDVSMIGTAAGQAAAASLANDVLSTSAVDIDKCVYQIYSGMVGKVAGVSYGALSALTDLLITQQTPFGPEFSCYASLEAYFKQLIQIQLKGATMMMDALHQRDNDWTSSVAVPAQATGRQVRPADYPGTAQQWLTTKLQPMIDEEVEEFLRCTDRIAVSQCDLRTGIGAFTADSPRPLSVQVLPDQVDEIWARADFIAAQLSPSRHSFGLNVRVVGEPKEVEDLHAQYKVQDGNYPNLMTNMKLVPLGQTADPGYPLRYNEVEHFWLWPSGAAQAYAQWSWATFEQTDNSLAPSSVSGHIKFDAATRLDIAKYNDPDPQFYDAVVRTTYPHESAHAGQANTFIVHWYDDNMNMVTASTAGAHEYGHATLALRHSPDVWYQHSQSTSCSDTSEFNLTSDGNTTDMPSCQAIGELTRGYDGVDEWFKIKSGIALPVICGSASQKLAVGGNLTTDCSNSFWSASSIQAKVWGYWTQKTSGYEYDSWDIVVGANGHTYGSTTAYHAFSAGEACPYHILLDLDISPQGSRGSQYSVQAFPELMYLYIPSAG